MKRIIIMVNPHFRMIKFFRLLCYHIYIYYRRKEGKSYAKFVTFCIFLVLSATFATTVYDIGNQYYDSNFTSISRINYIFAYLVIGVIIAYYLYQESFRDFDEFINIRVKYYVYFFCIVMIILALFIYSANISRKRIFENKTKTNIQNSKIGIVNLGGVSLYEHYSGNEFLSRDECH